MWPLQMADATLGSPCLTWVCIHTLELTGTGTGTERHRHSGRQSSAVVKVSVPSCLHTMQSDLRCHPPSTVQLAFQVSKNVIQAYLVLYHGLPSQRRNGGMQ
jgi:hypothetical protein